MINRGVREGKDDFHTMVFSNLRHNKVESRCVVLRDFNKENKTLVFNSDVRSPKVSAIQKNPETQCLLYHFKDKTQLRISTYSTVHTDDDIHTKFWDRTAISSRKCYLTKYTPSQTIESMDFKKRKTKGNQDRQRRRIAISKIQRLLGRTRHNSTPACCILA